MNANGDPIGNITVGFLEESTSGTSGGSTHPQSRAGGDDDISAEDMGILQVTDVDKANVDMVLTTSSDNTITVYTKDPPYGRYEPKIVSKSVTNTGSSGLAGRTNIPFKIDLTVVRTVKPGNTGHVLVVQDAMGGNIRFFFLIHRG